MLVALLAVLACLPPTVVSSGDGPDDLPVISTGYVISQEVNGTAATNYTTGEVEFISNDTAWVVQSVIDALYASGGNILFTKGDFTLTRALRIDVPVTLIGAGNGLFNGSYAYGTRLCFNKTDGGIVVNSGLEQFDFGLTIRDLAIDGQAIAAVGLNMVKASRCVFENVAFLHFTEYGVWLQEAHLNCFRGCHFIWNGPDSPLHGGLRIGYHSSANANSFWGCSFEWGGSGAIIMNSYSCTFESCTFEGNNYHGLYGFSDPANSSYAQHVTVDGCYFELNNIARSKGLICDVLIEGAGSGFWSIQDIKTAGELVKYSIWTDGWYTYLKNVRPMDRTVYWNTIYGTLDTVERLDPSCLPLSSTVVKNGTGLVAEGTVVMPAGSSSAEVATGLISQAMNVQVIGTSEETSCLWITDNVPGSFMINAPAALTADQVIYWRASV